MLLNVACGEGSRITMAWRNSGLTTWNLLAARQSPEWKTCNDHEANFMDHSNA